MGKSTCSISGCAKGVFGRGWCQTHYGRWWRNGDPLVVKLDPLPERCAISGCDRRPKAKGLCNTHYERKRKGLDLSAPVAARFPTLEAEFTARTMAQGDCLVWSGPRNAGGYGLISRKAGSTLAHRYAYSAANGPIPEGMVVDHICRNRACVKADHLRLATPKQNAENLPKFGSSSSGLRGVYKVRDNRFEAKVWHDGKSQHLGTYDSAEEAWSVVSAYRAKVFTHSLN